MLFFRLNRCECICLLLSNPNRSLLGLETSFDNEIRRLFMAAFIREPGDEGHLWSTLDHMQPYQDTFRPLL